MLFLVIILFVGVFLIQEIPELWKKLDQED